MWLCIFCLFLRMMKKILFLFTLLAFVTAAHSQTIAKWKVEDVVKAYSANNDTVYVVNFWATFCKPCIEEIPDFIRITDKYKEQKVKLLLVSLDLPAFYPDRLASFIKKNKFNTNHAWLYETNADHFCPMIDEKWSGVIPSTLIVNNSKGYRKFVEDQLSAEELEASLQEAMGGKAAYRFTAPMKHAAMAAGETNDELTSSSHFVSFSSADSTVYAVMNGTVSMVARIENFKVVIVKNEKDNLFYTYANLGSTSLHKGDVVKNGQLIGYATRHLDGKVPAVDFYLNSKNESIQLTPANFVSR